MFLIFYLHQQPTKGSPIITDNLTYQGILTHFIKPCKSKTWDMIYHWLEDRVFQKDIQLIWKLGIHNWAYYFTKHYLPVYHQVVRPKYLVNCLSQSPFFYRWHHYLWGCIIIFPMVWPSSVNHNHVSDSHSWSDLCPSLSTRNFSQQIFLPKTFESHQSK